IVFDQQQLHGVWWGMVLRCFPQSGGQPTDSRAAHDSDSGPSQVFFSSQETTMRRDTFLKSLAALAAAGALPLSARAAANVKMMIPANPGGGWDTTGRALGK